MVRNKSTDFNNQKLFYNANINHMRENNVDKRKTKANSQTTSLYFEYVAEWQISNVRLY